jgi:hypothetical protein
MTHFWLLYCICFSIIAVTTSENAALRTRQGIIYGRQTQSSIEYLGYDENNKFSDFCDDCCLEFNMQKQVDGNHLWILHRKFFRMVHWKPHYLVLVVHKMVVFIFQNKMNNVFI